MRYLFYSDIDWLSDVLALHEHKRAHRFDKVPANLDQDQYQRNEQEAEFQVQITSDDVLRAVSIPAYETRRWKEDSCSPKLDGDLAQGANKI